MKNKTPLLLYLCILLPSFVFCQNENLVDVLEQLAKHIQEVEAEKYQYNQSFTWDDNRPWQVQLDASRTDVKDKTVTYEQFFNLKDLDIQTVKRDNVKDLLVVQVYIEDKNKYIRTFDDGKQSKYSNRIEIIANDSDNARDIEEALKEAIGLAKNLPIPNPPPPDFEGQANWLTQKIVSAEKGSNPIQQNLIREANQPLRVTFTAEREGKKGKDAEQWSFNLIDINEQKIELKIDDKDLYVDLQTSDKNNYIRYFKNSELNNYQKGLKIYTKDIESGKQIVEVFKSLVAEAEKLYAAQTMATEYSLKELVQNVSEGDQKFEQSIEGQCLLTFKSAYNKKGDTVEEMYKVNLADLDQNTIKIEVSKKTIWLTSKTNKKTKLIQPFSNGEQQSFTNELSIRATDIENARLLLKYLSQAIKNCEGDNECQAVGETKGNQLTKLTKLIGTIKIGSTTYQQKLEPVKETPDQWKFTRIEEKSKGPKEENWVFNLKDLDKKKVELKISKKAVSVVLQTNQKESVLKMYVDQKPQGYKNEMEWLGTNIETTRMIICILQDALKDE